MPTITESYTDAVLTTLIAQEGIHGMIRVLSMDKQKRTRHDTPETWGYETIQEFHESSNVIYLDYAFAGMEIKYPLLAALLAKGRTTEYRLLKRISTALLGQATDLLEEILRLGQDYAAVDVIYRTHLAYRSAHRVLVFFAVYSEELAEAIKDTKGDSLEEIVLYDLRGRHG